MLMEQVMRRENMLAAYRRVVSNGGAPGIDGMTVDDLWEHCQGHWAQVRDALLSGSYVPQPVRRVEIPKPDGKGVRMLGIPTVMDRLIQQALLQILAEVKACFEELDQWLRRKLRCIKWRQWKKWRTRLHELRRLGLDPERARASACNGRGPWWNAGASHMNHALPIAELRKLGLLSLLEEHRRFACVR